MLEWTRISPSSLLIRLVDAGLEQTLVHSDAAAGGELHVDLAQHHHLLPLGLLIGGALVTLCLLAAKLVGTRRERARASERTSLITKLYDDSPVMMGIVEPNGDDLVFVSCNRAFTRFFGDAAEATHAFTARQLGHRREHVDLWLEKCLSSLGTAKPIRFEYSLVLETGESHLMATVSAIASRRRPRYSFVLTDVTERVRARRGLDGFFTLSLEMLCIAGLDGFFQRVNPSFTETLGWSQEQLLSQPFVEFVHPDDRDSTTQNLGRLSDGAKIIDFENRYRCADGSYRWLSWTASALAEDGMVCAAARDVTDAKASAKYLRIAKEQAEAATHAKSEFLANMSHELRTPLSAIIGMTELARNTALEPEQREYVGSIRQSANTLLLLVNDLLDLAKIESGKIELESVPFELERIVENSVKPLAYQAHRKGLELAYRISSDAPVEPIGDPTRLQQILTNLVSNAVKFTKTGHVGVEVDATSVQTGHVELQVRVRDTGVGIHAVRQKEIFQSFVQADGSTTRKHGGTGLGLAICAQLVSLMGGRIWVESEPDSGTTFHFTAPFQVSELQDDVDEDEETPASEALRVLVVEPVPIAREFLMSTLAAANISAVGVSGGERAVDAIQRDAFHVLLVSHATVRDGTSSWFQLARAHAPGIRSVLLTRTSDRVSDNDASTHGFDGRLITPVAPRHIRRALKILSSVGRLGDNEPLTDTLSKSARCRLRILVADDDSMNRLVTTKLLAKAGHEVVAARDGREALTRLKQESFGLVFMDVQMPEMDGLEVAMKVRAYETMRGGRRVPIIALTANARKEDREQCMAAGMDGYLAKPVEPTHLTEVAERFGDATAGSRGPRVFDVSGLEQLVEGDHHVLHQVVGAFLEETPGVMENVRIGIEQGDTKRVERAAHRLKGSLLTLGASSPAATLFHIEKAARENLRGDVAMQWEQLQEELRALTTELQEIRDGADRRPA